MKQNLTGRENYPLIVSSDKEIFRIGTAFAGIINQLLSEND